MYLLLLLIRAMNAMTKDVIIFSILSLDMSYFKIQAMAMDVIIFSILWLDMSYFKIHQLESYFNIILFW